MRRRSEPALLVTGSLARMSPSSRASQLWVHHEALDPEEFVQVLRTEVFDSAVSDVISSLEAPPGRRPSSALVDASRWFTALESTDRAFVESVIRMAAHSAVFGVLAMLDGVRVIDGPPHGDLELRYVSADGRESRLNPVGAELHDTFNGLVRPLREGSSD